MPPSLTYKDRQFLLDGAPYTIFSGAVHYFRVVPEYWRDRLARAKAGGLNTIETYVPWNVHEPQPGVFKSDGILDLRRFVQTAADLDLKVIFRPGPYICSEWDLGGLPSWLLADPDMQVRSNYSGYMEAAERYLKWVISLIVDLQYSKGGPIIAVQIENEYGNRSTDPAHLLFLKDVLEQSGIQELLVTSDNEWGMAPSLHIPGVVPTANFQTVEEGKKILAAIERLDPDLPLMAMEFWSGWFDHWGSSHQERAWDVIEMPFKFLLSRQASVNFYMYHGGTNFGFMAGANQFSSYKPDVTSYDYGAPLSEHGKPTMKYYEIRDLIMGFYYEAAMKDGGGEGEMTPFEPIPPRPVTIEERREIALEEFLPWEEMIRLVKKVGIDSCPVPKTMEMVRFRDGEVQSYGYIVYRKVLDEATRSSLSSGAELVLPSYVKDRATILINGRVVRRFDWSSTNSETLKTLEAKSLFNYYDQISDSSSSSTCILDIVVENLGRVNFANREQQGLLDGQRKGMEGEIILDGKPLRDWKVIALDFTDQFLADVASDDTTAAAAAASNSWQTLKDGDVQNWSELEYDFPGLYRARFDISCSSSGDTTTAPADCFVKMAGFHKGIVIVNGFNLGRYWSIGPQRTLYLPGPVLRQGPNHILVFEESKPAQTISFETHPELE